MKISDCIAVADRIAGMTEVLPFQLFNIDMTASMILEWDSNGRVIRRPAMARMAGQKESDRQLYTVKARKATPTDKVAERQARLDAMAAAYANNPAYEVECDTMALATGIAKACHTHGVDPSFLLDENGEL